MIRFLSAAATLIAAFALSLTPVHAVEDTWDYSVQVSATVNPSPAQINLSWPQDTNGTPSSYVVFRKSPADASWGAGATLPGSATTYTDTNVAAGVAYEYQIVKNAGAYTGYGYIEAGIGVPLVDDRGKLILIVDSSMAAPLASGLARLQQDLAGDGWTVIRHDVNRTDSVASVKALIQADFAADPARVKSVFLFGHVPVPYSGLLNPDGHPDHLGAWPADVYYGDIDNDWTDSTVNYVQNIDTDPVDAARITNVPGDGKFDQTEIPSYVELQVGRVDLANMPGRTTWGGPATFPSETDLLRKYLDKDHAFRTAAMTPPRRAILGDYFGVRGGEAFAASGFRSFAPLVGSGNVRNLNIEFNDQQGVWIPQASQNDYLLAYACGPGSYSSMGGIGNTGLYHDGTTTDLVGANTHGVFNLIFGSWLGDWDHEDDLLRAPLATDHGLVSVWAGRPHWFLHPLGLGETIGYVAQLTQNNVNEYQTQINTAAHRIHIALMGDPTLTLYPVAPAGPVAGSAGGGGVSLAWGASSASNLVGYHVYRAASPGGPYARLTNTPIAATSFTDTNAAPGATYMVRAVSLETTPSGSFYNASDGVFWSGSPTGATGGGGGPTAPDTTAPSVFISSPANGATVSGNVTVSADATDNVGVAGVQFKLDGANLGSEITSAPFGATIDTTALANGTHTLGAVARDAAGNMTSATTVSISVANVVVGSGAAGGSTATSVTTTTTSTSTGSSSTAPTGPIASTSTATPLSQTGGGTYVWIDDALPAGAGGLNGNGGDTWNWVSGNPAPYSGSLAHRSDVAAGQHGHWFGWCSKPMVVNNGDDLFAYVYLDPANPPSEIMLTWSTNTSWEHRAYWGADDIHIGSGNGHYYAGPLPATGQWVRLEIPASAVGLDGQTVTGMNFSLYDGGATWDATGTILPTVPTIPVMTSPGSSVSSTSSIAAVSEIAFFDDALPPNAGGIGAFGGDTWHWISSNPTPFSGSLAHKSDLAPGQHGHWFGWADTSLPVSTGDSLFVYVYLDPANPPNELMVEWSTQTSWEHRAYWGADDLNIGTGQGHYHAGALPPTGQWVRLEVPASAVGLDGSAVTAMNFELYNGAATWDKTGKFSGAASPTGWTAADPATTSGGTTSGSSTGGSTTTTSTTSTSGTGSGGTSTSTTASTSGGTSTSTTTSTSGGTPSGSTSTTSTTSTSSTVDTIWIDDSLPPNAGGIASDGGDSWNWISTNPAPYSGSLAHQTNLASGQHGHWFGWADTNLPINTGDSLFTYVYLDPANPPSEIMISWSTNTSWEHRAYWGADLLNIGTGAGHYYAGPLPATGKWVRLEIPASAVGLEGSAVTAMHFELYDGRAAFDASGRASVAVTSGGTSSGGSTTASGGTTSGGTTSGGTSTSSTSTTDPTIPTSGTSSAGATDTSATAMASQVPKVGDYGLRLLTPTVLELRRVLQKPADPQTFAEWNFVDSNGNFNAPSASEFAVTADGRNIGVGSVGFRRIAVHGQLYVRDLRVEACLYLTLSTPIADGASVAVKNPDGTLWPSSMNFAATADPLRFNPAIHVDQEGYVPSFAKKAYVGYYLGSLGEMDIDASKGFSLVDAATGATVYSGTLALHADTGYETTPLPYQHVYEADFSGVAAPGRYEVVVPGMGASLPFLIDDGIAMAAARTYELGMYEQRSGMATALPYTRFTHAADHTAPAEVPTSDPQYDFTWNTIAAYSGGNSTQTAPQLTSPATQLYPFVNQGLVDVSGGHFDAGDYSKYTIDVALLAHQLLFTADSIKGAAALDNLGIPESGDGISDIMQEGKWEADYLAKLQDADGGFYFIVYPKDREYEWNVLPEDGDTQVVWPKNTSATAAAVGALAEYASSPLFRKAYPADAAKFLAEAKLGWQFLMSAQAKYGKVGAYQKITFYGDEFNDNDELSWAAAALYAATGDPQYQQKLFQWFPDPADPGTFHWSWQRMYQGYGCAIRDYAFAARSGRLSPSQLDSTYLAACEGQVTAAGDDALRWTNESAYGTSFPDNIRHSMQTGWFFSMETAADMAVAYQIDPKPAYTDAIVSNLDYELGANPVNVSFVAGLGVKRPHEMVSQYRANARHVLPPDGEPMSNVHSSFSPLTLYGSELSGVSFPADGMTGSSYPLQDRFTDIWNVTTEFITLNQAHAETAAAFLAAQTAASSAPWKPAATLQISGAGTAAVGQPITLTFDTTGLVLTNARITWEAQDQQPQFGSSATITPVTSGTNWVEVEVEWPDGRRLFGTGSISVQ